MTASNSHETSPYCQALGGGRLSTDNQWLLTTHDGSNNWVRSKYVHVFRKSEYSITNTPSSPNWCSRTSRAASHSVVHSLDPSDQRPVHSELPHGLRTFRKRLPRNSTALTTAYAWSGKMACLGKRARLTDHTYYSQDLRRGINFNRCMTTRIMLIPFMISPSFLSGLTRKQLNRRSSFARTRSLLQNSSGSMISY